MSAPSAGPSQVSRRADEVSLLMLGTVVLRRRRPIILLAVFGAVLGLATGLLSPRVYAARARFLPGVSDGETSGLAFVASQFGMRVPTGGGAGGPRVSVDVRRPRARLE